MLVTLNPGESQVVSFTITPDKVGTYTVSVNGLQGEFTVQAEGLYSGRITKVYFLYIPFGQSWYENNDPQDCIIGGKDRHAPIVRVENTTIGVQLPINIKVTVTRPDGSRVEKSAILTLRGGIEQQWGTWFDEGGIQLGAFSTHIRGLYVVDIEISAYGQVLDTMTKQCMAEGIDCALSGHVYDTSGAPIQGAVCKIMESTETGHKRTSNFMGWFYMSFVLQAVPQTYTLQVQHPNYNEVTVPITLNGGTIKQSVYLEAL